MVSTDTSTKDRVEFKETPTLTASSLPQVTTEQRNDLSKNTLTPIPVETTNTLQQPTKTTFAETLKQSWDILRESFKFSYKASPKVTLATLAIAVAQSSQMLVYGLVVNSIAENLKHASDWKTFILPITIAAVFKYGIENLTSRSQNAQELQQANIEVLIQEKISSLSPQSLERLNQPRINTDYKIVTWGGIYGLSAISRDMIQGAGAAVSLGIGAYFIATSVPLYVTGLVALTVAYPAYKAWKLNQIIVNHEDNIADKRIKAQFASWSRIWPLTARLYRVLGIQDRIDTSAQEKRQEVVKAEESLIQTKNRYNEVSHLLNMGTFITLGLNILNQVKNTPMNAGDGLFLIVTAIPIFQSSLTGLAQSVISLAKTRPVLQAMRRLEIHKKEETQGQGDAAINWGSVGASVELTNLHFSYPPKQGFEKSTTIFKEASLKIKPGTVVAIVGDNGAGKSTLLQLLERSYKPIAGSISINDCDVNKVSDANLFTGMRVMPQQTQMIEGYTIRQFLSWGREGAGLPQDEALLQKILEKTGAHELFNQEITLNDGTPAKRLPEGLETKMGAAQGGVDFSGGEMAALYIAYMLYAQPKVICFDEVERPFSQERQNQFFDTLYSLNDLLGYKPTVVFVTHNLERATQANKIIFIDKAEGSIGGYDTHAKLLKNNNTYKKWYHDSNGTNPYQGIIKRYYL